MHNDYIHCMIYEFEHKKSAVYDELVGESADCGQGSAFGFLNLLKEVDENFIYEKRTANCRPFSMQYQFIKAHLFCLFF